MSPEAHDILILLAMLFLSAFFSGSEMAFLASNKLVIEINRSRHPKVTKIIDIFMSKPSTLIATILVGNNVTMVVYGLVFGDMFGPAIQAHISDNQTVILLVQTLISTVIIIVTAEFLPKAIIQINPSAMLNALAAPMYFFYILFYPIGALMQKISMLLITKVLRSPVPQKKDDLLPGRVDFDALITRQAEDTTEDSDVSQEARLMRNALDFSSIKVRDCFIPRTDIVAVSVADSVEDLHKKFVSTGLSKILVYQGEFDNIVGYVHVSEMFKGTKSIRKMMSPIAVVPETMRANMLLTQFTSQHKSIAVVVDEFGGISGMITLEDVLEEIFGEINDEHDQPEYIEHKVDDTTYVFSGRLEVDYLNEKYHLHLPASDDYDTLAGLLLNITQSIPRQGDTAAIEGFEFKVLLAGHATVDKVMVKKL